jgi:DNA polymerase III subunit delta'
MQPFGADALRSGSGFILVSNNLELAVDTLVEAIGAEFVLFPKPYKEQIDILVDDIDELVAESYLASDTLKSVVIKSVKYSSEVQNRLLKILEEPPKNIRFVILAKSGSALLPTIRSRMSQFFLESAKIEPKLRFDFANLTSQSVFDFLKSCDKLGRDDAKAILYTIFDDHIKYGDNLAKLNKDDTAKFERAIQLLNLNTQPKVIFADIMLTFMLKKLAKLS